MRNNEERLQIKDLEKTHKEIISLIEAGKITGRYGLSAPNVPYFNGNLKAEKIEKSKYGNWKYCLTDGEKTVSMFCEETYGADAYRHISSIYLT